MSFFSFPFHRWVSGIILLLVIYWGYGIFGNIVEVTLPDAATDAGGTVYSNAVVGYVSTNFFLGVIIMTLGTLLFLVIAGIPGQQEERLI